MAIIALFAALFITLVPILPSANFPASIFCSYYHGCATTLPSDGTNLVTGSLLYCITGYGGIALPNHSYVIITKTDIAQFRLSLA